MSITPEILGFQPEDQTLPPHRHQSWLVSLRGQPIRFRRLETLDELTPVEQMERDALGFSDIDLLSASALLTVAETGGAVLGAFPADTGQDAPLLAATIGWGGFFAGRPRLVSDFLGVAPTARSLGLGSAIKRLQAALAIRAGFAEIIWTVDPLRAANARLNFGKLRACADRYERNRYGLLMGQAHYGGLPSDRLHVTWSLTSKRVQTALLGLPPAAPAPSQVRRFVAIPDDIDRLVLQAPAEALAWRLRVRAELEPLLAAGWIVTDFASAGSVGVDAMLVLEQPIPQADH